MIENFEVFYKAEKCAGKTKENLSKEKKIPYPQNEAVGSQPHFRKEKRSSGLLYLLLFSRLSLFLHILFNQGCDYPR